MNSKQNLKSIETNRLILRLWTEADLVPFFEMNQDPKVIEFFPGAMSHDQVELFFKKVLLQFETNGYGFWAVELKRTGEFIGYTGLAHVMFDAPFTPAVEIGWRLASEHWGQGYATEAALAVMNFVGEFLSLSEIVSFTVPQNLRSQNVMKKIGMERDVLGDFNHPRLDENHPLSLHVLYRKGI
ncbi:MAG: N-acetyltransferase [Candidatus Margulisbacteria bacterium]|nr:N-acetyltransferase [Candidatus Margulisiibacteriota bacterium]